MCDALQTKSMCVACHFTKEGGRGGQICLAYTCMHLFCFVFYKYQLSQLPISLSPSLGNSCRCQGQKVGTEERVKTLQISSMHKAQQRKAWIFVGGGDKPSMLALLVERKWASIDKNLLP